MVSILMPWQRQINKYIMCIDNNKWPFALQLLSIKIFTSISAIFEGRFPKWPTWKVPNAGIYLKKVLTLKSQTGQRNQPTKWQLLGKFIQLYWKGLFVFVYPLVLLPIFLTNNKPSMRCLYVVCVMAGLWITEALPLAVTSLIPVVAFPLMGILDSDKTCECYMKETNMMFIGGLIIAIAVEHCGLHRRIALAVMSVVGCSPRLVVGKYKFLPSLLAYENIIKVYWYINFWFW